MYLRCRWGVIVLLTGFFSTNLYAEGGGIAAPQAEKSGLKIQETGSDQARSSQEKQGQISCQDQMELTVVEDGRVLGVVPYPRFLRSGIRLEDDIAFFEQQAARSKKAGNGNGNGNGNGDPDRSGGKNSRKDGKAGRPANSKDLLELFPKAKSITLFGCLNKQETLSHEDISSTPGCYLLGMNKKNMLKLNKCANNNVDNSGTFIKGIVRIEYTTK